MRKYLRRTVIMMLIVVFALAGAQCVSAVQKTAASSHQGKYGAILSPVVKNSNNEAYMPNAALVMFKTTKNVTKKAAAQRLSTGEEAVPDVQIEEVMNFQEPSEMVTDADGNRKMQKGSGKTTTLSVALIKSKTLSTKQLIKKMKARKDVIYAEPNYRVHSCSVNDPYYRSQWSMQGGAAGTSAYSDRTPNVPFIWGQGTTGSDRIVVVVDTGVDYMHPDLKNQMWHNTHYPTLKGEYGFDFIAGDDDPMDENGHGTHCAGIIGAQGNNGIGVSGVNQNIRIMAMRVLDADGSSYLDHEIGAYNYISKAMDLGEPVQAINNSWGAGGYSEIFATLIDLVGKKGAVTVAAAGNEFSDCDETPTYPACIDSPYVISVAATKEDGELVNFSNYGSETVDVAAPGGDILSTVPDDVYNPSIYGTAQGNYSAEFNSYESEGGWESVSGLQSSLYLNGEKYTGSGKQKISLSRDNDGFCTTGSKDPGHAVHMEAKNLKANDLICMTVPYEISQSTKTASSFSAMIKAEVSKEENSGLIAAIDVPQGTELDLNTLGYIDLKWSVGVLSNDFDNWSHMSFQTLDEDELASVKKEAAGGKAELDPLKREIILLIYTESGGNLRVGFDDMGMSHQDLPGTEVFGKYDFMSGTSMAAPFISGATALYAASKNPSFVKSSAEQLVGEIVSMARAGSMPIIAKGSFDFTKKQAELGPRMSGIKVDKAGGKITITGTGLNPSAGLTVQIGPSGEAMQTAQIISQTDTKVVVRDNNWINNVVTIKVTGYGGKVSSRSDLYLVNGKKAFKEVSGAEDSTTSEAMATDGKYIYNVDSANSMVTRMKASNPGAGVQYLATIDPGSVFGGSAGGNKNANYALKFGNDLAYSKGKLYTVVEYGEADEKEDSMDDFIWFDAKGGRVSAKGSSLDDEDSDSGNMAIYSSAFRLVSIDTKTGRVKNLGKLPSDLMKKVDYTMAAYKGKIYFIGGYSYKTGDLTKTVKVYNPKQRKKSKRWSTGKSLPAARAGGKAVQSGSRLVYTLGYDQPLASEDSAEDFRFPANLIFNGKSWRVSSVPESKRLEPILEPETFNRGGKIWPSATASVSAVSGGLVYLGMPVSNYGDAFLYKVSSDSFADSGINYLRDLDSEEIHGIAVKNKLFGFGSEKIYKVKLK